MRILYTIILLIVVPLIFLSAMFIAVAFEDFLTRKFGKPPAWIAIVGILCWLSIFVRIAWDQAGKLVNTTAHLRGDKKEEK